MFNIRHKWYHSQEISEQSLRCAVQWTVRAIRDTPHIEFSETWNLHPKDNPSMIKQAKSSERLRADLEAP
jgi:hypothetical protein